MRQIALVLSPWMTLSHFYGNKRIKNSSCLLTCAKKLKMLGTYSIGTASYNWGALIRRSRTVLRSTKWPRNRMEVSLYFTYKYSVLRIRIRDPVPFLPLDPGSGIGFFPDLGSRIPNPYFWELSDNFLGKSSKNSLKIGPNFFLRHLKTKILCNFVKFVAT